MKKLTSETLRKLYLDFFVSKGHKVIPSASLIPENDPSVLFTTAGMHPLVPYLLGEKHPAGVRLTDVQKCVRTGDIEEVGDPSHLTFFEMLGNWSLGDYFKERAIAWSYEFLTGKDYLDIPVSDLAVSVFAGDNDAPRDETSAKLWEQCGIPKDKIFYLPKKNNWWIAGTTGPCGPDTEMFIDRGFAPCHDGCDPSCDCGKYLEIWNNVFMEFYKDENGNYSKLKQRNVDTGMGLERVLCISNGYDTVYETDLFTGAKAKIEELTGKKYGESEEITKAFRIILDHVRTATFLIGDQKGIVPSNVDQGYVLRRLIRRAVRFGRTLGLPEGSLAKIASAYVEKYKDVYEEIKQNEQKIYAELNKEEEKFSKTLSDGLREFNKVISHVQGNVFPGKTAFRLYDTFGFPLEITEELAKEQGFTVDREGYKEAEKVHIEKSKIGSDQKFKGGLAEQNETTARLHTATHLLNAALKSVLQDEGINQRGSNITVERLRFDFNFPRKLTAEELKGVEDWVNGAIEANVPVVLEEMTVDEAKAQGAVGIFTSKYGDKVKVYTMGKYSKEICGGPHAQTTGELHHFRITKEEASSAGVRRIKAVLD
ncbi:MAG: alanine--tRNA ligase [Candidatus Borkfalkiaceae bacterium]|nr:alanine--tRNA ligase [Christensenellaceae bacterium]